MSILLRQFPYSITLSGLIGSSDTSITVSAGDANDWPDGTFIKFAGSDEICQKTAGGGTTSWTIRRGEHATTAETHADGTTIYRLAFNVSHAEITLGKDGTALDPPTLALTSLLNGFELSITAPTDTGNRLAGYEVYKGTATAPTTLFDFVTDTRSSGRTIHLELDSGEDVTDTFYFRAKSRTKSGVLSTTYSNEVSGTAAELDSAFLQKNAQSFITDIVFSATDNDTVQWTAGTLKTADGTSYSINSGNTGNMTELVVIYFDPDVSTTDLQIVNVSGLSVAINRIWVAMAQNQASTAQDAFFVPFVGVFGINETQIGDNSISTSKIQALAITAGKIAANTITSAQITTGVLTGLLIQTTAGGTIRTDSANERIVLSSTNGFEVYGTTGVKLIQIPVNTSNIGDLVFTAGATPGRIIFSNTGLIYSDAASTVLFVPDAHQSDKISIGDSGSEWSTMKLFAQTIRLFGSSTIQIESGVTFDANTYDMGTAALHLDQIFGKSLEICRSAAKVAELLANSSSTVYLSPGSGSGTTLEIGGGTAWTNVTFDVSNTWKVVDGATTHLEVDTSGNVGVKGSATGLGRLYVNQGGAADALPAIYVFQADVSEEFIRFHGSAAAATLTQSIVDEGDVTTATRAGWVKVYVQDDGNQITDQAYFMPLFTLA